MDNIKKLVEDLKSSARILIEAEESLFELELNSFLDSFDSFIAILGGEVSKDRDGLSKELIISIEELSGLHNEVISRVDSIIARRPEEQAKLKKLSKALRVYNDKLPAKIRFFAERKG